MDSRLKENKNTKDKILTAATKVFHKKGFGGARMQEIADRAKVNKAALHYYFTSKEKLFEIVLINSFKDLFISFEDIIEQQISLMEKLNLLIDNYIEFIKENRQNFKFVICSLEKNKKLLQDNIAESAINSGFFEQIYQEIQTKVEEGKLKPVNPRHLIVNLVSMCILPFLAEPILKKVNEFSKTEMENFLTEHGNTVKEFAKNALQK